MQNSRLFQIIYLLLDRKKATAKELAEHFEVSERTIRRDVDALSLAGIPVTTARGKGGGISLLDNFVLRNSLLTGKERDRILMGLQSLKAAQYPETEDVLLKLNALFRQKDPGWIEVDFSGWGTAEKEKFSLLKEAIMERRAVFFEYFGANGAKTLRTVEPLRLLYKSKAWYLQGYCRQREAYRIFKLSRIRRPAMTKETFERDVSDLPPLEQKGAFACVRVTMRIDACMAYRVYDEFDGEDVEKTEDGFLVQMSVPEDEWLYGYILSFGEFVRVEEPERIREALRKRICKMQRNYGNRT